jgi:hypothetical protein
MRKDSRELIHHANVFNRTYGIQTFCAISIAVGQSSLIQTLLSWRDRRKVAADLRKDCRTIRMMIWILSRMIAASNSKSSLSRICRLRTRRLRRTGRTRRVRRTRRGRLRRVSAAAATSEARERHSEVTCRTRDKSEEKSMKK